MYKKITHHIVEEHFEHPAATEIKNHVDAYCPTGPIMSMADTPSSMRLKMTLRTAFNHLIAGFRGHVVAHTAEEISAIDSKISADITNISNLIKSYYGDAAAVAFRSKLDAYIIDAVKVIEASKAGPVSGDLDTKLKASISDLASFLGSVNPTVWPADAVTSILTKVAEDFVAQVTSRAKKDYAGDIDAFNRARQLLVNGSATSTGFADIVANGIIQQFPALFRI